MATYTCMMPVCTRDVCVIHGRPSAAELDSRRPHKVGGYNPFNPRQLCELPSCGIHKHEAKIFGVPLSLIKKGGEKVDGNGLPQVGVYDPMNPRQVFQQPDINSDILSSQDCKEEAPVNSPQNPTLELHQRQVFVSDGSSSAVLEDEQPSFYDSKKEDFHFPGGNEFSTPAEAYVNKLVFGVRGRWTVYVPPNKDFISKIFADEQEREDAVTAYGAEARMRKGEYLPHIFMYGIRYMPEPKLGVSSPESRLVTISGLNHDVTVRDITAKVKGGKIISISTAIFASQSMAFIQFAECQGAQSYVEYMDHHSVAAFGNQGRVFHVNTHSYPIPLELEEHITHGCTRLLAIQSLGRPEDFIQQFSYTCTHPTHILEDVWIDCRGVLFVLFKSITQAVKLFRDIHRQDSGIAEKLMIELSSVVFARDPCDQPVDTIDWSSDLAREPYPSLLVGWTTQTTAPTMQLPEAVAATESGANSDDVGAELKQSHSCSEPKQLSNRSLNTAKSVDSFTMGNSESDKQETQMADNSGGDPLPKPELSQVDSSSHEDCEELMPKYMLPQDDPAYKELLTRDRSDLVSKAEAMAIFNKQPSRSYSKDEIRTRYSAFFPIRDMMAAWKRGDMDYDPDVANKKKEEEGKEEVEKDDQE
ncbi:hypothetical protein GGR53DRAFT_526802 [Hypoxylon sp. FL1150]|nr:hypothetical protein GGR53DRAFT_526802 [Hypoxylon sp. FL1150]